MKLTQLSRSPAMSIAALAVGGLFVFLLAAFTPYTGASQAKPNKYVGAEKCKNCHASEETGNQHAAWMKMAHAKAFERLGSDEAKKAGAAKNIADPQKDDACLKCHVTGHGVPAEQLGKGFDFALGVQCESCHGPGELHIKKRMAGAAKAKKGEPAPIEPGELVEVTPQTCTKCHNTESPTYKPFCYFKRREETKHLNPKAERTEEQKRKLDLVCGCGDKCPTDKCATGECGVPKAK